MAQCVYGQTRKGTRRCPALGGFICARCCGRHRGVDIDCPSDCVYFVEHSTYQQQKQRKTVEPLWHQRNRELALEHGPEAVSFLAYVEMVICSEIEGRHNLEDLMVLDAYEYLRRRLSPLAVEELVTPPLGARLWEATQQYLEGNALPRSEDRDMLDILITFVRSLQSSGEKSDYMNALLLLYDEKLTQLRRNQDSQSSRRIMTPEEFRRMQRP